MIELSWAIFLDMDEPSKMLKNSPCLNPKGVSFWEGKIYENRKKKWSTKYFLRVWLNLSIQAGSFGRCQALVTSSSSRGMLQGTWIHMKLGSLGLFVARFSEEKSHKHIPPREEKYIIWRVHPQTTFQKTCIFCVWGLLGPSSLFFWFGDLLFVFSSNDISIGILDGPRSRHPPSTNPWPKKLGLQFVTGMTLLGNYYIVMFINQLLSGLIIPNSLVSCVMWMETSSGNLGVFQSVCKILVGKASSQ